MMMIDDNDHGITIINKMALLSTNEKNYRRQQKMVSDTSQLTNPERSILLCIIPHHMRNTNGRHLVSI